MDDNFRIMARMEEKYFSVKVYLYTDVRMTVTVKLDDERKREVEKFLATLLLDQGVKVTLQEALGLMVDFSLERREELIQRLRSLPPLEKDSAWRMLQRPDDWGVTDASERVDETLYGR